MKIFINYVHAYLDDLLAMPVILGITLQVYRWIHPLKEKFVFSKIQVLVGWAYFSFLFEFFLPRWSSTYTADIIDVLCYGLGAIAFYKLININR
ncbi:magnesium citrate secondary transporter [Aquiflexum sp.]|uniref:magnesium citrate secondary transporter n=1 Tax=Aquiflexum sp. TaxID=1872584 RepID=UPI003593D8EF